MRARTVLTAALLLAAVTGCQQTPDDARPPRPVTYTSPPHDHGAVFLGPGDCSTRGAVFREVPCTGEKAVARVTTRYDGLTSGGPTCPATTDFVLHVSESVPTADEDGDGSVPRGYACMRNLEPPHPGDPGQGGGPHTIVGDCVSASGEGEGAGAGEGQDAGKGAGEGRVKETACDGSGERPPAFRVTSAVTSRDRCPPSTALFVALGGERPVGCARRL
ncbi:hypothetical protein Q5762_12495 [Streptomyces sp. P9(2023)]|uniref:hypothetical protein n=1 Tax=Streptomyces sp. P9(2023) TaxID=3064394 RepID=UPI0028F425F7|nr:hypothetical protein [Streptomyces sp. P9(2023)]MDT9689145.1 hypothetical protein [Streptomyces sp. P9(2023)]